MKVIFKLIVLCLIIIILDDLFLANYGRGSRIYPDMLPKHLNVDFHKYDGFMIQEDGIIQVVGRKSHIDNKVISNIFRYKCFDNEILLLAQTELNDTVLVRVYHNILNSSQIEYSVKIDENYDRNNLSNFIDVSKDSKLPRNLLKLRFIMFISLFILFILYFIFFIKRKLNSPAVQPSSTQLNN